jgi:hypothetical protein
VQAQPDPRFSDEDVRAFLDLARAAVLTRSLDAVSHASVEARIQMIAEELRKSEPRYGVVESWGRGLKDLLLTVAHPTVIGKVRELSWP